MTSVTPETAKPSRLRLYDLLPTPIQGALAKIGLNEKFFQTFWRITRTLRVPPHKDLELLSRPLEFLAGSISAFVTLFLILGLFAFNGAPSEEPISLVLKEYLFVWLLLYLVIIVISFVGIHIDIIFGFFFPAKQEIRISYAERLCGCAYIVGWIQFLFPAFLLLDLLISLLFLVLMPADGLLIPDVDSLTAASERITTPLIGILHLSVLARSGLINGRRFIRFSLLWFPLAILILFVIGFLIWGH